jgi:hypothetical protein
VSRWLAVRFARSADLADSARIGSLLHKFGAMFLRPFQDQGKGSSGHLAFQDVQGPDVDQHFMFRVERVEVRWSVIV